MSETQDIPVPDIGDFDSVEVIEILISPGDTIAAEDSLITLESDKASMEIPAPFGGTVKEVKINVGDNIAQGDIICTVESTDDDGSDRQQESADKSEDEQQAQDKDTVSTKGEGKREADKTDDGGEPPRAKGEGAPAGEEPTRPPSPPRSSPTEHIPAEEQRNAHASPGVRRFARELGVELTRVQGSGRKGRIRYDDVKAFVKESMQRPAEAAAGAGGGGLGVPPMPEIDFSEFGEIETQSLTKINKLTGQNLHRNWVTVPHVTQFDKADITDLEAFRKQLNEEQKKKEDGVKFTMVTFLMKAAAAALQAYPRFNSSLDPAGEHLIFKKYYHIGVAVDTPDGLVVPVIRDVDQKSLVDLAGELMSVSKAARNKKLSPKQMKGGCISISSLGGVGGTAFTPIVNSPEVAIVGASKAGTEPVWNGQEFEPRLMLPLSLSYDHRVIDGADAARFTTYLSSLLADMRRMLL
ncbi:MAG: branched-chain alpha-keto acid dehydrogenase subunit E2 [Proteobacteria bacterium SW_6_67_9]|nr:MAG: branched-chain alpha-keto acid dehydrogenase subunit E2 [Proteobacteria bacterium SW_6_67_9]